MICDWPAGEINGLRMVRVKLKAFRENISVTADHTTSPEYLKQAVSSFSNADHAEQIA